jgi:predicted peroxiredoxin
MRTMLLAAALAIAAGPLAAQDAPKLVTVVTSAEPQTQLMAMVLSMQAAQQGAQVHILLCGPGGDLALKDAPASATAPQPPRGMSPQGLMQTMREKVGATVEVCAIYLPGKGADASVLLDGVGVAQPPEMAARMMDPATRLFSF